MSFDTWIYAILIAYGLFMAVILGFCKAASDQDKVSEEYHVQVLMYLAEQQNNEQKD